MSDMVVTCGCQDFLNTVQPNTNTEVSHMLHVLKVSYFFFLPNCSGNFVLNENAKNGHPCLVPNLRGKVFSFSPLGMLAMGLSYCVMLSTFPLYLLC